MMKRETLYLKDVYSVLGENRKNPTLDLYLPFNMDEINRQDQKRPRVIVCPGGAYAFCSQREAEPIALQFLPLGFNAFVLTYSTAPHAFPTQLCEVAATIELIHKNQDKWNCDPNKIVIIGFSAGGHLAAHHSTMYDCKEVRAVFPESKPVSVTVLSYPVITSDERYWHEGSIKNLAGNLDFSAAEYAYFSCERNVKSPPSRLYLAYRRGWGCAGEKQLAIRRRFKRTADPF